MDGECLSRWLGWQFHHLGALDRRRQQLEYAQTSGYFAFLNVSTLVKGAPLVFEDGQIGLPVYHEFLTKFAEVIRLDASGRVVDKTRIPGSQTSLQPVVLVTGAKTAQVFMRSGNARALMVSGTQDAGNTWSQSAAADWPNPDSALAGVVTSTGGQWLALNPTKNNRETLALLQAGTAPFLLTLRSGSWSRPPRLGVVCR